MSVGANLLALVGTGSISNHSERTPVDVVNLAGGDLLTAADEGDRSATHGQGPII